MGIIDSYKSLEWFKRKKRPWKIHNDKFKAFSSLSAFCCFHVRGFSLFLIENKKKGFSKRIFWFKQAINFASRATKDYELKRWSITQGEGNNGAATNTFYLLGSCSIRREILTLNENRREMDIRKNRMTRLVVIFNWKNEFSVENFTLFVLKGLKWITSIVYFIIDWSQLWITVEQKTFLDSRLFLVGIWFVEMFKNVQNYQNHIKFRINVKLIAWSTSFIIFIISS